MRLYNSLQIKAGAKIERNRMGVLTQPVQFLLATYLLKEDANHEANEGVMELIESFTEIEKHYFNIYLKGYGL